MTVGRTGRMLMVRDAEGLRHLLRPSAVACLSDADPAATETLVTMSGGRSLLVPAPLEEVAAALANAGSPGRGGC